MSVRAFQPRQYDPPRFVAETEDDLVDLVESFIDAGQCDSCGNHTYRVRQDGHRFYAVCHLDPDEDPEFRWPEACGKAYPITVWDEDLVEF